MNAAIIFAIRPGNSKNLNIHCLETKVYKKDDEHDIKLAYSCWREWQHRGDDLYRRVASARLA